MWDVTLSGYWFKFLNHAKFYLLKLVVHLYGTDNLPFGMFSVGDSIMYNILKENHQDTTSLVTDDARDTFHNHL